MCSPSNVCVCVRIFRLRARAPAPATLGTWLGTDMAAYSRGAEGEVVAHPHQWAGPPWPAAWATPARHRPAAWATTALRLHCRCPRSRTRVLFSRRGSARGETGQGEAGRRGSAQRREGRARKARTAARNAHPPLPLARSPARWHRRAARVCPAVRGARSPVSPGAGLTARRPAGTVTGPARRRTRAAPAHAIPRAPWRQGRRPPTAPPAGGTALPAGDAGHCAARPPARAHLRNLVLVVVAVARRHGPAVLSPLTAHLEDREKNQKKNIILNFLLPTNLNTSVASSHAREEARGEH